MPERTITEGDAEAIAEHMTTKLIDRLADEKTVDRIMAAWSGHIDRCIGRGLRRMGLYVLIFAMGLGAIKLDLIKYVVK